MYTAARRECDTRPIVLTTARARQGLTVYCTLYLAEKGYPCSVATFSPQGEGTAIIPPLLAPVQLLETLGSPPGENRFGCQPPATEDMAIPHGAANDAPQDWLVEATVAGADEAQGSSRSKSESGGNIESGKMGEAGADDGSDAAVVLGVDGESVRRGEAGGEEEDDDDIFAALAHVSVTRGSPVEDGKRTGGDLDGVSRWAAEGTDYFLRGGKVGNGEGGQDRSEMLLGAIAVVDRGECTFEQKVRGAARWYFLFALALAATSVLLFCFCARGAVQCTAALAAIGGGGGSGGGDGGGGGSGGGDGGGGGGSGGSGGGGGGHGTQTLPYFRDEPDCAVYAFCRRLFLV